MKKLINIEDLRVGMFVCGFNRSWIKTPFLSHLFLIESDRQLQEILALDIETIYIDTDKGLDVYTPVPVVEVIDLSMSIAETVPERQYISIESSSLMPGSFLTFDVYQNASAGKQLYLKNGAEITQEMKKNFSKEGLRLLYVAAEEEEAYATYLSEIRIERDKRTTYTSAEFFQYNKNKEIFFPIERDMLNVGTTVDFSLYTKRGFFYDPILIVERAIPVELKDLHLRADGEISIYHSDIPKYQAYITRNLILKGSDSRVTAIVTRENAKIKVKEILDNYADGQAVRKDAIDVVQDMVDVILKSKGAFVNLLNLQAKDMYTYTHSVNVATLAVGLGNIIGLSKDQLFDVGLGCILHDIGKTMIPLEILNKPDRLTLRERDVMMKHVIYGHRIVSAYKDIPPGAMIPILQHHETLIGSGYPFGIRGDELELFGKIVSIVDLYDAITTDRPYKKAFSPFYALSIMSKDSDKYDTALYAEFVKMLGTKA